ncbi:MAG TPA: tetratricopeptide repeat protein [Terracidiphilus sp.]|nr:tetratricopeptide repeat protein [Terracidiphilus sp.]
MFRRNAVSAGFAGVFLSLSLTLPYNISSQTSSAADRSEASGAVRAHWGLNAPGASSKVAVIQIEYPQNSSIFPREITAPTFIWHDGNALAVAWRVDVRFADGEKPLQIRSSGERMPIGEIDARCVAGSNRPPTLTAEQAGAHTWKPSEETWELIKRHAMERPAVVEISGLDPAGHEVSQGRTTFSTSRDAVDGQIFYRDVPLMPFQGKKGIVQPLSPSLLYLINWRMRDISKPESRIVMSGLHTCANCHSFSRDGKTMGMDVDGPANDKGLYAIVPVQKHMSIRSEDTISWNADLRVGKSRVGFMSQVSPDGKYVLSTFAGKGQDIPSSYFVVNFKDYGFLQVFYPTRGILAWYNRVTGRRQPLPGADDPQYVQTDGVWSPDDKYVVFARAKAKDPDQPGQPMPAAANDPTETQIQYDLYRVPFNDGKGGKAEPIAGASNDGMSNSFPKISPDGHWIVFVKAKNGQLMRPDSELYIVPAAGGVARRMRCNTSRMNSWHSFSPNGRWLVFSSKSRSPYTQMFLTHIDAQGNDSPAIYIDNSTAANRAVNIPEFVNVAPGGIENIDMPASDLYRVVDEAMELQGKGDNAGALAKWQDALAMDPNDARANNGIGIVLGVMGRPEEAIPYFQKAGKIQSDFFEAFYNLGIVLAKLNRFDEAIEAWQNTVRIRPEFAQGHENLGYVLYLRGRFDESIAELRLALKEEPNRPLALNLAASLLATCPDASIRNGDEALTLARRAAQESAGNDLATLDTLSAAYAEVGDFAEAVKTEEAALAESAHQGDGGLVSILRRHLERYESKEPIRTPQDFVAF